MIKYATGILPICKKTGRILVLLRSGIVNEPFTWANAGGLIDVPVNYDSPDWSEIKKEALRELLEETGYSGKIQLHLSKTYEKNLTERKHTKLVYYNWIGIVSEEFSVKLCSENADFKWVTLKEMGDLKDSGVLHNGVSFILSDPIITQYTNTNYLKKLKIYLNKFI
jgi:8-oxo-dGTP pyrophosphatase MutT (NUDIX family)